LAEAKRNAESLAADAEISTKYTTYIRLADLQNRLGLYQEAIASVDKIAAERQGNSRVWLTYATSYKGLNQIDKAKAAINRTLEIDDEVPEHWRLYFEIYTDLSNEELNAKYMEALQKTKNDLQLVISYARFLEKIGDKDKAVIYWETARNADPANASTYEAEITRLRRPL
jgi:tetratricopeptide (TPR) repeat protein